MAFLLDDRLIDWLVERVMDRLDERLTLTDNDLRYEYTNENSNSFFCFILFGFMVSWFHGFVVSWFRGFAVSWFHGT